MWPVVALAGLLRLRVAGLELENRRVRTRGGLFAALECVWPGLAVQAGAVHAGLALRICAGNAGLRGSGGSFSLAAAGAARAEMPGPLPFISRDRRSGVAGRICPFIFGLGILLSPKGRTGGAGWRPDHGLWSGGGSLSWQCGNCAVLGARPCSAGTAPGGPSGRSHDKLSEPPPEPD